MRLDKFRGWGSWLAFASPSCVVLAVVSFFTATLLIPHPWPATPPVGFLVFFFLALVLLGMWMVTMLAVALDLEWIEHPLTHTGLTYVALAAAAVATIGFVLSLFGNLVGLSNAFGEVLSVAWLGGVGIYLFLINLVGRRARVLRGVLPWIGIVAGVFAVIGMAIAVAGFPAVGFLAMPIVIPLYIIWSTWLGFVLRGNAPAPAPVAAGQPA